VQSAPSRSGGTAQTDWRPAGLAGVTVHSLALGQKDRSLVVAGTEKGIYRRDRSGRWHRLLAVQGVWSVGVAKNDTILAGDEAGDAYIGSHGGTSWRHTNLAPLGAYAVAIAPGSSSRMLAGTGAGIYLSTDAGRHWQLRLPLSNSGAAAIAWQPGSSRVVLAGAVATNNQGSTQVYISRDAGRTWHVFGHDLHSHGGIMSLGITTSRVFAGTMGKGVWMAPLASGAWRQMIAGMPTVEDHVAGIGILPGTSHRLIVGTLGFGVFMSDDGGKHWMNVSHDSALSRSGGIVLSLAYLRAQHSVLAGTSDGVYELVGSSKR
jgi:predicted secreted protein